MSPRPSVGTEQQVWTEVFNRLPSDWTAVAGSGTETLVALATGQNVLQAAGYRWREYPLNIKFNPTWLYRVRIRVRRTATSDNLTQSIFIGVAGVREDGTSLCAIDGTNSHFSQHYVAAASQDMSAFPLNEWQEFVGYFRGWGATGSGQSTNILSPGGLHQSVRYFRPLFILNYNGGPAGNVLQIGNFVVEAIQQPVTEFVHLIEANFSGGTLYLNTGARDLYWNGNTYEGIGGILTFDGVQEANDEKGRGVGFQLAGVDQTIVATLLNNNYRGRVVRVYRAYLDPVSGQVIDPDDRGIRIGRTTTRYAHRNPVGTWPTGDFSIEFWGRLDSGLSYTEPNVAFDYGAGASLWEMMVLVKNNTTDWRLNVTVASTASNNDTVAYPDDHKWHHICATWVKSTGALAVYLDGVLRFTQAGFQTGHTITGGGALDLGVQQHTALDSGFVASEAWKGELDRVRVYSRVLDPAEIAEHFHGTFLDTAGLPVSTWSFDNPNNMGKDGSRDDATANDLTMVGIPIPAEGSPVTRVMLLFEGLQLAPYEIEENRDRTTGTVTVKMQAIGYLGVDKIRGIEANTTSHQHVYPSDTFFQNVAQLANLKIYWGTAAPASLGGGVNQGYEKPGGKNRFL